MLRSKSPECYANLCSPLHGLYFWFALVLNGFVSWLLFLFVVGCLSLYSPKSVFMASVRFGHRFQLFGVMPSSVLAIAKR
jgi:hypothetical protein